MTRLATIMENRGLTYATLAARAGLQPRTVRRLVTGATSIDQAAIGTIRQIASALAVTVDVLLEEPVGSGNDTRARGERLSAAIRDAMWPPTAVSYPAPLEAGASDSIADSQPDEYFAGMPAIGAQRG